MLLAMKLINLLCEPNFQLVREALADGDDFATFAVFHGNEDLIEATSKVATLLSKMRDISLKQTILDSFFLLKGK